MALDDGFLKALGRITANFQALEIEMAFFASALIGPDQGVGLVVTSQLSFRRLCTLLTGLFKYRVQDTRLVDELGAIVRRAAEAEQRRNIVVHSNWLVDEKNEAQSVTRLKITSRRNRGLEFQTEEMSADDLNEIAKFIADVAKQLMSFMERAKGKGAVDYPSEGNPCEGLEVTFGPKVP